MEIDEFALLVADLRRLGYEIRGAEIRRLGGGGGSGEGVPADVRAAFERFDVNGSGRLDYHELRGALQAAEI